MNIHNLKCLKIIFCCLIFLLTSFCYIINLYAENKVDNLKVVDYVDIDRYLGTWYEIARYPNRFEKDCVGVTARYSLTKDGKIEVINSCFKKDFQGKKKSIKGKAWIVDKNTNAKLKVRFFWPFAGDYWIIDLGKDYEYAVVGEPKRRYLWVLSREPYINEDVFNNILEKLKQQGYDINRLIKVQQFEE